MIGTKTMIIAPSPSEKKQSALIIGIIALCIHGGLGSLFFLSEPTHSWLNADEAQVILFDEQKCNKPPHTTLVPEKEEWGLVLPAELLMLAGRPATAKETPTTATTPIVKQKPAREKPTLFNSKPDGHSLATAESLSLEESTQTDQKQKSTSLAIAESLSPKKSRQTDTKQSIAALTTTASPSPIKTTRIEEKSTASTQTTRPTGQRHGSPSSKQLSLASLGKGFLEQLPKASYGRNFMPGSERAKLAASQIAIEEYNTRFEKMVGPLMRIIFREVPVPRTAIHSPSIGFNISPEGKLIDLCISQSSGDALYDQQLLTKAKEINPYGPPLPESVNKAQKEKNVKSFFHV